MARRDAGGRKFASLSGRRKLRDKNSARGCACCARACAAEPTVICDGRALQRRPGEEALRKARQSRLSSLRGATEVVVAATECVCKKCRHRARRVHAPHRPRHPPPPPRLRLRRRRRRLRRLLHLQRRRDEARLLRNGVQVPVSHAAVSVGHDPLTPRATLRRHLIDDPSPEMRRLTEGLTAALANALKRAEGAARGHAPYVQALALPPGSTSEAAPPGRRGCRRRVHSCRATELWPQEGAEQRALLFAHMTLEAHRRRRPPR